MSDKIVEIEPDEMEAEWLAWQDWHKEFTRLTGININHPKCDQLVALTRIWGEMLATLRRAQGDKGLEHSKNVVEEELDRVKG